MIRFDEDATHYFSCHLTKFLSSFPWPLFHFLFFPNYFICLSWHILSLLDWLWWVRRCCEKNWLPYSLAKGSSSVALEIWCHLLRIANKVFVFQVCVKSPLEKCKSFSFLWYGYLSMAGTGLQFVTFVRFVIYTVFYLRNIYIYIYFYM